MGNSIFSFGFARVTEVRHIHEAIAKDDMEFFLRLYNLLFRGKGII